MVVVIIWDLQKWLLIAIFIKILSWFQRLRLKGEFSIIAYLSNKIGRGPEENDDKQNDYSGYEGPVLDCCRQ